MERAEGTAGEGGYNQVSEETQKGNKEDASSDPQGISAKQQEG